MDAAQTYIANVANLTAKTVKESWYNTFWARWSGNVDISEDDNGNPSYRPSGKPIEMMTDFIQAGRDNMLLPMEKRLTGDPVYGDTVLKGTGEDQDLDWLRVYVNQYRKAVTAQSGRMANQRIKIYNMMKKAKPRLQDWLTQYENQEVFRAYYEGVSRNLSIGTAYDGLGLAKRLHPNWVVNNDSTLAHVGTQNKTKTAAQLDTAAALTLKGMSVTFLEQLNPVMMTQRIPQIVSEAGFPYWAGVISPQQKIALLQETDFQAANRSAWEGLKTNAELRGFVGHFLGFAFFEDLIGIRGWDTTNDNLFGSTTAAAFAPTTVTGNHNAIFFGNSSMGKGIAEGETKYTTEIDDHENVKEIGLAVINGYNRADYFDEDDANEVSGDAFYKNQASEHFAASLSATNQSSLIAMTKPTLT